MSYITEKEAKLATEQICLTRSFVDEILHIVIGVIQPVVIFVLVWLGQNQ